MSALPDSRISQPGSRGVAALLIALALTAGTPFEAMSQAKAVQAGRVPEVLGVNDALIKEAQKEGRVFRLCRIKD